MKKNSSLKRLIISGFSLLFTVAVVLTAIFLPGDLVMKEAKDELEQVVAVPVEYQAAPSEALVRNISRQLTEEQRLSLIYGTWDSTIMPATSRDTNLTEYQVAHLNYPLNAGYQSWYSWSAVPYKAVDNNFKTYAAVFWKITFTKYDGSETIVFYTTENGTLLDSEKIPEL